MTIPNLGIKIISETTVQAVFSSEHLRNPVMTHGVFINGLLVNNPDRGRKNALTAISRITITTNGLYTESSIMSRRKEIICVHRHRDTPADTL